MREQAAAFSLASGASVVLEPEPKCHGFVMAVSAFTSAHSEKIVSARLLT